MAEEQNSSGTKIKISTGTIKKILKRSKKIIFIILAILIIMWLVPMIYVLDKSKFNKAATYTATYEVVVGPDGKVTYIRTNEDGSTEEIEVEEIAGELGEILDEYISAEDTEEREEKMEYIVNAETVTKMPYISSLEGDETALNGVIKFSRPNYTDGYMTFINQEEFAKQKNNFETSGNTEILKHFTLDDEGQVCIAYIGQETRTIETNDSDLTEEIVKEASGEEGYAGNYKDGFKLGRYTIYEKPLDYLALVEQYIMPVNLLNALLVQTRDINFVTAIADLAYDSEIIIGIYDNETTTVTSETYNFKKFMEMKAETELDFSKIRTTPMVEESNLKGIAYRCIAKNSIDEQFQHKVWYYKDSKIDTTTNEPYAYITGIEDGKIAGIGNSDYAKTFVAKYTQTIKVATTPTIGVNYADTWIAKWTSAYNKEEGEPYNTTSTGKNENKSIIEYTNKDEVINAFNNSMKTHITEKLDAHATELKDTAISKIIDSIDFTVEVEPKVITIEEVELQKQLEIIKKYIYSDDDGYMCDKCKKAIETSGIKRVKASIIHLELINDEGILKGTEVERHYIEKLTEYVNLTNETAKEKAKNEASKDEATRKKAFQEELQEEITISQELEGAKYYVDINFESIVNRNSSTYQKSDTTERENDGEKFSEVFNNEDFYKAREALLAREEWFWEYIRDNEDTAKLEDVLRYLLNIATNSNDFGDYTEEEIEDLFQAFEPKQDMKQATVAGIQLLKDYIRSWENQAVYNYLNGFSGYTDTVAKYINEEKTKYYIRDDGKGNPTVGFGIDIFNGGYKQDFIDKGYTEAQLKDTSGAVEVDVEFVDKLEEQTIKNMLSTVRERTSSIQLKNYQIYALVSRAFNCGIEGALNGYTGTNFINSYTKYFDPNTDDKYGEYEGDYTHSLYTEFMYSPTSSSGEELTGLVERRKSEWTLFQTGYMDRIGKFATNGDILEMCNIVTEDMITNGVKYYTDIDQLVWGDIAKQSDFSKSKYICCTSYVAVVLYRAEIISEDLINSYRYQSPYDFGYAEDNLMKAAGWTRVSVSEAQAGDVCNWYEPSGDSHTFIYAGGNEVWDQNNGTKGKSGTISVWDKYTSNHDVYVYRKP